MVGLACRWSRRRVVKVIAFLIAAICFFNIVVSSLRFITDGTTLAVVELSPKNQSLNVSVKHGEVVHWNPERSDRSLVTSLFEDQEVGRRMVNQRRFSQTSGGVKKILLIPHANYPQPPDGDKIFHDTHCPITDCVITRSAGELATADALMFQKFNKEIRSRFFPKRISQIWIACSGESPAITEAYRPDLLDTRTMDDLFNWTVYYRRDATIPIPSGVFLPHTNSSTNIPPISSQVNYAGGRTKKIAWFVSNCGLVTSGRMNYVQELAKYIAVDIYGQCGTLKCPNPKDTDCNAMLRRDYKFYLAFENSNCRDYISEKFFHNALGNDLIPIAYGPSKSDYETFAPASSFIHVDDFATPHDLANYLLQLDSNDALYNEYFRWKSTGQFLEGASTYWCQVCTMLHANDRARDVRWYQDFHRWWNSGVCLEQNVKRKWYSWKSDKLHYSKSTRLLPNWSLISVLFYVLIRS